MNERQGPRKPKPGIREGRSRSTAASLAAVQYGAAEESLKESGGGGEECIFRDVSEEPLSSTVRAQRKAQRQSASTPLAEPGDAGITGLCSKPHI